EEFVDGQRHRGPPALAAATVAEGDRSVVAPEDGLVGQRRPVHVATEILEHLLRSLDDRLGEDDPRLAPGDLGKRDVRQGAAREVEEASAEELGERAYRDEV